MPRDIKICGIRDEQTVEAAITAGATHIGLVHFAKSPRHVDLETASRLRSLARGRVKTVLLLVNASVEETGHALEMVQPDVVQFHGNETPEWTGLIREKLSMEVWKALGVRDAKILEKSRRFEGKVDRVLFDAPAPMQGKSLPGGNGTSFDWSLLATFNHNTPWGLAGGLDPVNVAEAIAQTGAELVDTSSGVENAPGVKDMDKIRAFCEAARQ